MGGTQILQPEVTLALANKDRAVSNEDQKVLVIGQMVAAGSAVSGELQSNLASTGAPENALFGESAMISAELRAFKAINPIVQVDAIGLDDASGTPRVVKVTFVGTATAAGTLVIVVGSETLHRFEIAIADEVVAADIPALCVTAINADTKCPFTASDATGGVLDLTADNDGTVANDLGVETSGTIAGITGMAVTEDTAGATDPTLTTVLDVATERYQGIVWPYGSGANLDILLTWLDARFNPTNAIEDGVAFVGKVDTHANLLTALDPAENSPSLVVFCDKAEVETNYFGPSQNEPSYSKAAMFAAIRSLRLSQDASISRYVTSNASLDQFGGPALASLPYFNTPIPQMPGITAPRGWTQLEISQLTAAGGSVIGVNANGSAALVGEVVTTYKTDSAANPDPTFGLLNYVDTASQAREYFFRNYKARFAQSRLTAGNVSRGRDMANDVIIRAYTEQLYKDLSGPNYVLVQDGEVAIVYFKENLTIVLDLETGKVTITMFIPIVTQLRQIIATVKIAFDTEG